MPNHGGRTAFAGSAPVRAEKTIPSLDGLRAVSIALVLFSHCLGTRFFFSPSIRAGILDPGRLGVRVFFIISGYLITRLLLQEQDRTGTISLKNFYLRRAFRIMPALFVFLLVISALDWLGFLRLPNHNL